MRALPTRLLPRLLAAVLLPTLGLLAVSGLLAYRTMRRSLDQDLGRRLISIAQAMSTEIRPETVFFLERGDDDSRTARRLRSKLEEVKVTTGAGRIFVLDHALSIRGDTDSTTRIGDLHYHAEADRTELDAVFQGRPASSVLFAGVDGRSYKIGYAPIFDHGSPIAAVGVEGSAQFFTALNALQHSFFWILGGVALLVVLVSSLVSRQVTRPIRRLADEANRIGQGHLDQPITVQSTGEVAQLAGTMNQMRADLRARHQEFEMMLSGIAHEVRNPLAGMLLFAGILREEMKGDPERLEMVGRIERELGYLDRLVNDFLQFARTQPLPKTRLDLGPLIESVAVLMESDATSCGVTLKHTPRAAAVYGDEDSLRRVVINLIRNAIQSAPAGSTVFVRCSHDASFAVIEVEDQGAGISEEQRELIFSPFYTTREKGSGLGLALSRKVALQHGGTLEILTTAPKGAIFRLRIPLGSS